jgi:hypothetical protein
MRVTEDMTTEGGALLATLADFTGLDDTGILVTQDGEHVIIEVDSTAYPSKKIRLTPDDAGDLACLIIRRASEARHGVPA